MKKMLLVSLLFIINETLLRAQADDVPVISAPRFYYAAPDTIPVIFLVSDTSEVYFNSKGFEISNYLSNRSSCTWITGYIVYGAEALYRRKAIYLNKNKEPLPSTLLVWMSVSRNP